MTDSLLNPMFFSLKKQQSRVVQMDLCQTNTDKASLRAQELSAQRVPCSAGGRVAKFGGPLESGRTTNSNRRGRKNHCITGAGEKTTAGAGAMDSTTGSGEKTTAGTGAMDSTTGSGEKKTLLVRLQWTPPLYRMKRRLLARVQWTPLVALANETRQARVRCTPQRALAQHAQ